ncbi:MAG: tRNA modification GTPase [Phycisphaerae bacterium]|jgi:tRNA modification GTPase
MIDRIDDTVVAISSAPGSAPIGIVRLSGPQAITMADSLAVAADGRSLASRKTATRVEGAVRIDTDLTLPALFNVFLAPRSYTRQHLVEIHTVGSPAALELVRRRIIAFGALPAEPGEFTARAFVNGAMDLAHAEAVAGLIRAQTDTQLRASHAMMAGSLARSVTAVTDELGELLALVEADIDFAEEPIEFITPPELRDRLARANDTLVTLMSSAESVERFDVLPHILLFGPPNVGKSSLMNRLSGTSRAICAAAAGTTRDILSAPIPIGRAEAVLLDTAGVDRSDDEIIAQARAMTMSRAEEIDLLCLVLDITRPPEPSLLDTVRSLDVSQTVVAANKADLLSESAARNARRRIEAEALGPVCTVSALQGSGIQNLRDNFAQALGAATSTTTGESVLISERQQRAIRNARGFIRRGMALAQDATETIDNADLVAFELREAVDMLGSITGQVTTDDLLGQVFASFCIGK